MTYIINKNPTKIKYTTNFLAWLKAEKVVNQNVFTIQDLFEIYINQLIWNELPKDKELQASDLVLRM